MDALRKGARHTAVVTYFEEPWPDRERVLRAVRFVVDSLVMPEELDRCALVWTGDDAPPFARTLPDLDPPPPGGVWWLRVRAEGEEFIWRPVSHDRWIDELPDLADRLEDWVCETRFAWGQQRTASLPSSA